jgi:dTDP-4-amino-4,6-dideoxy-D-galactose acyltransferase
VACELLAWDSAFFGRRIARLHGGRLDPEAWAEAHAWCRERAIDCLYFLADPVDPITAPLAEQAGFRLVDLRVTLDGEPKPALAVPAAPPARIRPAETGDVPALRRIAAVSHRDSRFYYDPHFERARCDELYATWIEKSCQGEAAAVLVAEVEGRAGGYITCLLEPAAGSAAGLSGRIGLFAVAAAAQGRGVGSLLIDEALAWLAARGAGRVSVVTQGRNRRAQRIYQKAGLLTRSVELWYHRWFPAGPDAAPGWESPR